MAFETNVEMVRVLKVNLDYARCNAMMNGTGIRLTTVEPYKKGEADFHGHQSPFFGTNLSSDHAYEERYTCKCGKYIGKAFWHQTCERCKTVVDYVPIDLSRTGWIINDYFPVISPIYYEKLVSALGSINSEPVINLILEVDYDNNKKISKLFSNEKSMALMKKHPFLFKGMIWFSQMENFEKVMNYYLSKAVKKSPKEDLIKELLKEKNDVFTHSIPAISSILRTELPSSEKGQKIYKMKINTYYQALIKISNNINSFGKPEGLSVDDTLIVDRYLANMQEEIDNMFNELYNMITGKNGLIQGKVLSGRYNYSGRCIIIPGTGRILRSNEIALPYISFAEFYRYEITNIYARINKCTIIEADNVWKESLTTFNNQIYCIMNYILEKQDQYVNILTNRNPSINYLSFQMMKVAYIKDNLRDKTMSLNTLGLTTFAADFDGDQMNIYRTLGLEMSKRFRKSLDPSRNMFINRIDSRVNRAATPQKDELACFYMFNNL